MIDLYLNGGPERPIDTAQPATLFESANIVHPDQPLCLLGHGVENPANGVHRVAAGDEDVDRRQQSLGTPLRLRGRHSRLLHIYEIHRHNNK